MNILDASALLCLLKGERGSDKVRELLKTSEAKIETTFIHQINLCEVEYKVSQLKSNQMKNKLVTLLDTPFLGVFKIIDYDISQLAAYLKSKYPISLADAIGLAFTKVNDGTFYTADQVLKPIADQEKIRLNMIR